MGNKPNYSDDFRASAVVMLEAQGYPNNQGALTAVANHLKVPARTLSRWFNKEQNPPPDQLVKVKKGEFVEKLDGLLDTLVIQMSSAAEGAPLNHLAIAFGVVVDKKQLLEGKPTDRQDLTVHDDLTDDERAARIASILERARDRRDRSASSE